MSLQFNGINSTIKFNSAPATGLFVRIDTPRTYIRSVTDDEAELIAKLFSDKVVMAQNVDGKTVPENNTIQIVKKAWAKWWKEGRPYSAFVVFKNDTKEFLGVINLFLDYHSKVSIGCIFQSKHWNQGYFQETAGVIVQDYIPVSNYVFDQKVITITARTWRSHEVVIHALGKAGFRFMRNIHEDGKSKFIYELDLSSEKIPTMV